MSLQEALQKASDATKLLSMENLKVFSDLSHKEVKTLWHDWQRIQDEQRIKIVKALHDLAENSFDMDFRQMFLMCLEDSSASVRSIAVDGLYGEENLPMLRRLLQLVEEEPSNEVRTAVMLNLSRFAYLAEVGDISDEYGKQIYAVLMNVVNDTAQPIEVRRRALEGAGYFGQSLEIQQKIGEAYAHNELAMQESALVAMGRSMNPIWFSHIMQSLQSASPALRYEAAKAAGEFAEDGRHLLGSLFPLVDDTDSEVSQAAIWALGEIGGRDAQRVLKRLVQSKDIVRSQAASDALEALLLFNESSW